MNEHPVMNKRTARAALPHAFFIIPTPLTAARRSARNSFPSPSSRSSRHASRLEVRDNLITTRAFLQRVQPAMAGAKEQQDCLFCNLCGSLLAFDSASFASCLLCQNQRSVKDFQGTEIWYKSTPQDFMRRLGVDLLIQPEEDVSEAKETDQIQQRAVVNDECPKCKNPSLEYYTKQLRSADEGQTVFYECPKCHHKFSQNM